MPHDLVPFCSFWRWSSLLTLLLAKSSFGQQLAFLPAKTGEGSSSSFSRCFPLQFNDSSGNTNDMRVPDPASAGSLCLRLDPKDTDHLQVDFALGPAGMESGWVVDDLRLWVGTDLRNLPADAATFPYLEKLNVGARTVSFYYPISLENDLSFGGCSNIMNHSDATEFVAVFHATAIRPQGSLRKMVTSTAKVEEVVFRRNKSLGDTTSQSALPFVAFSVICTTPPTPTENVMQRAKEAVPEETMTTMMNEPEQKQDLTIIKIQKANAAMSNYTTAASIGRRDQTTCPTPPDTNTTSLSQDLLQKFKVAAELSEIVTFEISGCIDNNIESCKDKYELCDGWWTLKDQALVAKDNGTCYAVFMGTVPSNVLDQLQNINPFFSKVPDSDCKVRCGYKNAYFNSYYKKMKKAVDTCVQSCGDEEPCPLILHGHSQGGSIATIAAIDLREYNPITMTFGTPRTIRKTDSYPCQDLDTSQQYRFINTNNDGQYDERVMNDLFCPNQVGIALLLDDVNYPIANVGLDNDAIREPTNVDIHEQDLYTERIKNLAESSCFPVPITAWPTGHYCNYNDECLSGSCTDQVCT